MERRQNSQRGIDLALSLHGDLPDPDLIVRTGGEYRLSNFLIWASGLCEYYADASLWPDFD